MKRPLLWVGSLFAAGVLVGDFVAFRYDLLLAISFALAVAAMVWSRARGILIYPLIFVGGWAGLAVHTAVLSPDDLQRLLAAEPELAEVRGVLRETPTLRLVDEGEQTSWHTVARLEVSAIRIHHGEWRPAFGRMAVSTRAALTNIFAGQTVEVSGVVAPPRGAAAPGLFDYRSYLKRLGIYYHLDAASLNDWKIVSSSGPPYAERFRSWARRALARGLPTEDESLRLEWALTLGWKAALTEGVSEPFIRAATYHIFAVDGLRMAIVFGIFFGLFRVLQVPRPVAGFVLLPLIWFYVALTGWPASAIRATVMLSIVIFAWIFRRPIDLLNSLFAAAFIILAWDPQQLFQAGFQLSFLVVLCIILILPAFKKVEEKLFAPDPMLAPHLQRRWHPILLVPAKYVWEVLLVSLAAWLGAIPLVAYYFNIVTPVSTPANLLAVPLCGLVLICNLSSLVLAAWFPAGAELFNYSGWWWMECIRVSSDWFARWPKAYWYVSAPTFFGGALYYVVLLGLLTGWLLAPKWRIRKLSVLGVALLVWAGMAWQRGTETKLFIVPLNGGHAIYFDAPGSKDDLLIDCGSERAMQSLTKPFLRARGVNRLPNFLLTHGNIHQIGAAESVNDVFKPKQVWASPVSARSPAYREAIARLERIPGLLHTVGRGDAFGSWTVLHPESGDHFSRGDDSSVVLTVDFGGMKILLLSDLGRPGQTALLERNPSLRADIVIGGIPTAGEPICDALLDAVRPRLIIVTDSEFPVANRASAKLCDRLERRRVPVVYTRLAGTLTVEFRKKSWQLRDANWTKLNFQNPAPQRGSPQVN
jgi:competence protein ComEC